MLDEQIRRFLTINPVVQTISFSMRGITDVTPQNFALLSECFVSQAQIANGHSARQRIQVSVSPRHISGDDYAMYVPSSAGRHRADTLYFRGPVMFDTSFKRAIVYHELIHALHDAIGSRVSQRDGEAASWLGEAWFHLECGHNTSNPPLGLDSNEQAMFQQLGTIFPIAAAVKGRFDASGGGGPVEVTQEERTTLRAAMGPLGYDRGWFDMNGIRGRRIRRGVWR